MLVVAETLQMISEAYGMPKLGRFMNWVLNLLLLGFAVEAISGTALLSSGTCSHDYAEAMELGIIVIVLLYVYVTFSFCVESAFYLAKRAETKYTPIEERLIEA